MHRDLKPDNILISQMGDLKIGDLGLAKSIAGDELNKILLHSIIGTPIYAAPNVINEDPYSNKCDVWSAGVIIFEMLEQQRLFSVAVHLLLIVEYLPAEESPEKSERIVEK